MYSTVKQSARVFGAAFVNLTPICRLLCAHLTCIEKASVAFSPGLKSITNHRQQLAPGEVVSWRRPLRLQFFSISRLRPSSRRGSTGEHAAPTTPDLTSLCAATGLRQSSHGYMGSWLQASKLLETNKSLKHLWSYLVRTLKQAANRVDEPSPSEAATGHSSHSQSRPQAITSHAHFTPFGNSSLDLIHFHPHRSA